MGKELVIVIPARNEEQNIGQLLDQLKCNPVAQMGDIVVINDASEDATGRIAREHGATVINQVFNLGYGCALQLGYKYAQMEDYKYLIQMDADGQHDVCNLESVYRKLTEQENGRRPDIILGSRFLPGSKSYPVSYSRRFAGRIFSRLIEFGTGTRITDPTTGLQGLDRRAFSFYAGYDHFDDMYPDANMVMQMLLLGFCVEEIPAVMHERKQGSSMHSGLKPVLYMFRMIYSILAVWMRIRWFHVDVEMANEVLEEKDN